MTMPTFTPVENYDALEILREVQLNQLAASITNYLNNNVRNNLYQVARDVFGPSYEYNNDGIQTVSPALIDLFGRLSENELVTGQWSFQNNTSFTAPVSSTSTFSSSAQQRAKLYRATTNQSIPDSTETLVSFNAESYDVGAMHDNSINPSRITIPSGGSGSYNFLAQARFVGAECRFEINILKNGSKIFTSQSPTGLVSADTYVQASGQDYAAAGDYYEVVVYQNNGSALDLVFGERNTNFSCIRAW